MYQLRHIARKERRIMKKLFLAAVATMAVVTASIPVAHAGNGFSFGVHVGEQYPGYEEYPPTDPDWEDQEPISCLEGRQIVRDQGYRRIEPVKCEGNTYPYRAFRRGNVWVVRVDAWSGQIVSERRIGYN